MKKKLFIFSLILSFFAFFTSNAQNNIKITGTIQDANTHQNIYGVKIAIVPMTGENEINSTYSDFTGNFILKSRISENRIKISFLNYKTTYIKINEVSVVNNSTLDLQTIFLESDIEKQIENTSSIVDVVENRKSPIASSTLLNSDIQTQSSNKDFIEVTNDMSGAFVSRMGGGFGDSQLRVRGFEQNNLTPMIDGISLYDLENGNVDWSGFTAINDAISSIQLQKGLGASKLVNSSVAGTVNLILKDAFSARGGSLFTATGNNGYKKFGASYGTGKLKNGFGLNFMLTNVSGDGYIKNTDFNATGYFIAFGYENQKNNLQFKLFGTPQWHNQRNSSIGLNQYFDQNDANLNPKYNRDWGYYQNNPYTAESNNSHKPIATLQWDYKFNENDKLSAKVYGSKGKSTDVRMNGNTIFTSNSPYLTSEFGQFNNTAQIDFDYISGYNQGQLPYDRYSNNPSIYRAALNGKYLNSIVEDRIYTGISQIANNKEINSYGAIINLDKKVGKILKVNTGLDYRKTDYNNYRTLENLFGADGYAVTNNYNDLTTTLNAYNQIVSNTISSEDNIWNIFNKTDNASKVNYDFTSKIDYLGAYMQVEANFNKVNILAQGGFNRQFLSRTMNNLLTNTTNNSASVNIDGYNAKLGINYNINENHNLWANGGIVSRAPIYTNIFSSFSDVPNKTYKNEDFKSAEAGYGFSTSKINFKLNGYLAFHEDSTVPYANNTSGFFGATTGINKKNYGVEAELTVRPTKNISIFSTVSYGEWKYTSDAKFTYYGSNREDVLYVKDNYIGGMPQTMINLGASTFLFKGFQLGTKARFHDRLYSNAPIEKFDPVTYTYFFNSVIELPNYLVVDSFLKYDLALQNGHQLNFCFNMDNVLDRTYLMESNTSFGYDQQIPNSTSTYGQVFGGYKGVAKANNAYFGFGRTWNFAVRYNF